MVPQLASVGTHMVCMLRWKCEEISGTVRNVQYSGSTPESKLSVAVSVTAEAACFMKHGKVWNVCMNCSVQLYFDESAHKACAKEILHCMRCFVILWLQYIIQYSTYQEIQCSVGKRFGVNYTGCWDLIVLMCLDFDHSCFNKSICMWDILNTKGKLTFLCP